MKWDQRKQLFLFQAGGAQHTPLLCTCRPLFPVARSALNLKHSGADPVGADSAPRITALFSRYISTQALPQSNLWLNYHLPAYRIGCYSTGSYSAGSFLGCDSIEGQSHRGLGTMVDAVAANRTPERSSVNVLCLQCLACPSTPTFFNILTFLQLQVKRYA